MKQISYFHSMIKILTVAVVLVASYRVNSLLFDGTQFQIYPGANLIFIPSFVKLISVLVFGWHGLIGLVFGTLFLMDTTGPLTTMILNVIVFGCSPMFALVVTNKICKISSTLSNLKYYHIILLSVISASFGMLNGIIVYNSIDVGVCMMVGDFSTDMILLFSLSMMLRSWEFFTKSKK